MDNFASLENKVALVTGAAVGIGRACAEILASGGARVMLSDINLDTCVTTAEELTAQGLTVSACGQDVVDEAQWTATIDNCLDRFGGLDVLVNNAGIFIGGLVGSNSRKHIRKIQEVNVDSIVFGTQTAAEVMKPGGRAGKGGSIINLSSIAGIVGVPGHSVYGATKGAVRSYTKHTAVEFGRLGYGIRVNSVHPGLIETAMAQQVLDDFIAVGLAASAEEAMGAVGQMTPLGRLGSVREVANLVRFLASDASSYCTGAEWVVDGGVCAG